MGDQDHSPRLRIFRQALFVLTTLIGGLCVAPAQVQECPSDTGWVPVSPLQSPPAQVCGATVADLIDNLLESLVTHECQFCDLYERCPQSVGFNPDATQGSTFKKPYFVPGVGWCSYWTSIHPGAAYRSICGSCP